MIKLHSSYDRMNKEKLKTQLRLQMEQNIKIVWENYNLNREVNEQSKTIEAMENALLYKEKVIEKYKSLLETSVEHLFD